jgi:ADP-ribosylglycohydrolase
MNTHDHLLCNLEGLSIGDAFGERFFISPDQVERYIGERMIPGNGPDSVWLYTDDTVMALSVAASLVKFGTIHQDWLAEDFVRRYDPSRGYGPAMHRCLTRIREGEDWRQVTPSLFEGFGSYGNGAAMRVTPLGAYFSDDLERVVVEAKRSAIVTHSHPEAIAGAIAAAVATALAHQSRMEGAIPDRTDFLGRVESFTPDSQVRDRIRKARAFSDRTTIQHAVTVLGNGTEMSAYDTVPFALWCASKYLTEFEEALWLAVSGLGDRDTICAIVGGIVASFTGIEGIPRLWRVKREKLPSISAD